MMELGGIRCVWGAEVDGKMGPFIYLFFFFPSSRFYCAHIVLYRILQILAAL